MSKSSLQDVPDLHVAIRKGQFHDVRFLVSHGDDVNVKDPAEHRTPLMLCAMIDQEAWGVGIARLLLAHGAMVGHADRRGQNALMTACIFGRAALIDVFLKAVDYDPNQRDRYGNTALFYAASQGRREVVEPLLASLLHFKLPVDRPNKWGMTPLLEACRMGHREIVQMLENHGAATDARDGILHWGVEEWLRDYDQRAAEAAAPRRKAYDKPWLMTSGSQHARSLKRTISVTSTRNGSDGLPSIPSSGMNHRSDAAADDDVFHSTAILVSHTKSGAPFVNDSPKHESRRQKVSSTSTKRRMLFKAWIQDLTKGQAIMAIFSPAPAITDSPDTHSTPTASSSCSLARQRSRNNRHQQADGETGCYFQSNFKQIFRRYEIQSSDSFRQRAKSPEHPKIPGIHASDVDQHPTARNAHPAPHTSKLSRQQSRMNNMGSSSRLASSSSSLDLNNSNTGRKSKASEMRMRTAERGKHDDSSSSVSSEDSAARLMMNAFRRRKGSVAPP